MVFSQQFPSQSKIRPLFTSHMPFSVNSVHQPAADAYLTCIEIMRYEKVAEEKDHFMLKMMKPRLEVGVEVAASGRRLQMTAQLKMRSTEKMEGRTH